MITEDYCSFEVAKLLKEKGFKIDTNNDYWKIGEDGTMYFMSSIGAYTSNPNEVYAIYRPENSYPCPTLQMAMKWLREVHNLHIDIDPSEGDWNPTVITLEDWSCVVKYGDNIPIQDSYEEAVEAALKYTLKHLI